MTNLEQLVPSFELCRKIPADAFNDTALVWKTYHRGIISDKPYVAERDTWDHEFREDAEYPIIPAPTAQEILEGMRFHCPTVECSRTWDGTIHYSCKALAIADLEGTVFYYFSRNLPEALLKLWLDVREVEHADQEGNK